MSTIGKVFIVLNFILSAAFVGWALNTLATTEEYKKQLADAKTSQRQRLAEKQKEIDELRSREPDCRHQERRRSAQERDQYQVRRRPDEDPARRAQALERPRCRAR